MENKRIEEISVIHVDDMPEQGKKEVMEKVTEKRKDGSFDFKGFAEVRMVSASPVRIESVKPIEGTDIDWFQNNAKGSEIDISDIF